MIIAGRSPNRSLRGWTEELHESAISCCSKLRLPGKHRGLIDCVNVTTFWFAQSKLCKIAGLAADSSGLGDFDKRARAVTPYLIHQPLLRLPIYTHPSTLISTFTALHAASEVPLETDNQRTFRVRLFSVTKEVVSLISNVASRSPL